MNDKALKLHLSQSGWGRSCLHLAAAMRAGHWRWHLAGIGREFHFTPSPTRRASAAAADRL